MILRDSSASSSVPSSFTATCKSPLELSIARPDGTVVRLTGDPAAFAAAQWLLTWLLQTSPLVAANASPVQAPPAPPPPVAAPSPAAPLETPPVAPAAEAFEKPITMRAPRAAAKTARAQKPARAAPAVAPPAPPSLKKKEISFFDSSDSDQIARRFQERFRPGGAGQPLPRKDLECAAEMLAAGYSTAFLLMAIDGAARSTRRGKVQSIRYVLSPDYVDGYAAAQATHAAAEAAAATQAEEDAAKAAQRAALGPAVAKACPPAAARPRAADFQKALAAFAARRSEPWHAAISSRRAA